MRFVIGLVWFVALSLPCVASADEVTPAYFKGCWERLDARARRILCFRDETHVSVLLGPIEANQGAAGEKPLKLGGWLTSWRYSGGMLGLSGDQCQVENATSTSFTLSGCKIRQAREEGEYKRICASDDELDTAVCAIALCNGQPGCRESDPMNSENLRGCWQASDERLLCFGKDGVGYFEREEWGIDDRWELSGSRIIKFDSRMCRIASLSENDLRLTECLDYKGRYFRACATHEQQNTPRCAFLLCDKLKDCGLKQRPPAPPGALKREDLLGCWGDGAYCFQQDGTAYTDSPASTDGSDLCSDWHLEPGDVIALEKGKNGSMRRLLPAKKNGAASLNLSGKKGGTFSRSCASPEEKKAERCVFLAEQMMLCSKGDWRNP